MVYSLRWQCYWEGQHLCCRFWTAIDEEYDLHWCLERPGDHRCLVANQHDRNETSRIDARASRDGSGFEQQISLG
jgi:hypothetical protein